MRYGLQTPGGDWLAWSNAATGARLWFDGPWHTVSDPSEAAQWNSMDGAKGCRDARGLEGFAPAEIPLPQGFRFFEAGDAGCYGCDDLGHDHIRERLAALVENLGPKHLLTDDDAQGLCESLRGPMPDDASDEDEALEILQRNTVDALAWEIDGGLYLRPIEDVE